MTSESAPHAKPASIQASSRVEKASIPTNLSNQVANVGADITVIDKQQAIINGPTRLRGADVEALDIRSGACLVLAGLVAEGETRIGQIQHLRRGYEDIVEKFASLGAEISYL